RDQRDGGGDSLSLAVASSDEVGDRGDVLRLGKPHDAHDQRRAEPNHQDRAEIDRQEVEAGAGGEPDRAEEGRGCTIDGERERVDKVPPAALATESLGPVPVARNDEQQADIAERKGDDDPALQHDAPWSGEEGHATRADSLSHRPSLGVANIIMLGSLCQHPRRVERLPFIQLMIEGCPASDRRRRSRGWAYVPVHTREFCSLGGAVAERSSSTSRIGYARNAPL